MARLTDSEGRNELRECDEEEIQVVEELELLVENEREEREDVVLLVLDNVGWVWRLFPLRSWLVEMNRSRFRRGCGCEGEHLRERFLLSLDFCLQGWTVASLQLGTRLVSVDR